MFWEDKEIRKEQIAKKNRRRERHGKAPKKYRAGRWILNILLFCFACVFIYSAYRLYNIYVVYHHNTKVKSEMQEIVYNELGTEELTQETYEETKKSGVDLISALRQVNPQIIGWIHVDDTTIDYPVAQGTDNDYYLNHNVYKEDTICGAIFMDYTNVLGQPLQNYILYGHRMRDDSMFGHLSKYLDSEFYLNHPTFTLILPDGYYTCEIFAVYQTTTYGFVYNRTFPGDEEQYLQFINACKAQSMYESNVTVTAEDNIVTLSTCDYSLDVNEGRLVVQAKLVKQSGE